jgi:hypothetical protein
MKTNALKAVLFSHFCFNTILQKFNIADLNIKGTGIHKMLCTILTYRRLLHLLLESAFLAAAPRSGVYGAASGSVHTVVLSPNAAPDKYSKKLSDRVSQTFFTVCITACVKNAHYIKYAS